MEPLKIIRLIISNFKKIKAIDITPSPDDNVVVIGGMNDQGKTSVLDAIQMAFDAAALKKQVTVPIREGADHSLIDIHLGNGKQITAQVSRTFTSNGASYLNVWTEDTGEVRSPQAFLDAIRGQLSFDPIAFARMDEGKARETLRSLVHFDVDLPALEAEYEERFAQRTDVNRILKQKQGALACLSAPAADVPDEETSSTEIVAKLQAGQDTRLANETKRQQLATLRAEAGTAKRGLEQVDREIEDLEAKLATLRGQHTQKAEEYTALVERGTALAEEVAALVDPDLSELNRALADLERHNAAVRSARTYRAQAREVATLERESNAQTARLRTIEDEKAAAFRRAQFPIEGLGFSDTGVTFNGLPFQQASTSNKLKVSMAIAMALNPTLRLIRIDDGSLLDPKNMEIIREMTRGRSKDDAYQLWIEVVSDKIGIQIEDGAVKDAPLPEVRTRRAQLKKEAEPADAAPEASVSAPGTASPAKSRKAPHSAVASGPVRKRSGILSVAPPIAQQMPLLPGLPPPPAASSAALPAAAQNTTVDPEPVTPASPAPPAAPVAASPSRPVIAGTANRRTPVLAKRVPATV